MNKNNPYKNKTEELREHIRIVLRSGNSGMTEEEIIDWTASMSFDQLEDIRGGAVDAHMYMAVKKYLTWLASPGTIDGPELK